ncbi:MAG: hypothetical protein II881_08595 [Oscillospiraceae bacterium]|nr:hypothetical protein [Oscillospiraceae bacterium]
MPYKHWLFKLLNSFYVKLGIFCQHKMHYVARTDAFDLTLELIKKKKGLRSQRDRLIVPASQPLCIVLNENILYVTQAD